LPVFSPTTTRVAGLQLAADDLGVAVVGDAELTLTGFSVALLDDVDRAAGRVALAALAFAVPPLPSCRSGRRRWPAPFASPAGLPSAA
jgi:hypothetical protein